MFIGFESGWKQRLCETLSRRNLRRFKDTLGKFAQNVRLFKATLGDLIKVTLDDFRRFKVI